MTNLKRHLGAVVLAVIGLAAAESHASLANIVPVSQHRYIFESIGEENFIESAPDFGPFSAAFTAVTQTSSITDLAVTGIGSAGPDEFFSINSVTSYFELVFDINEPFDFTFSGAIATGLFGSAAAQLSGPGGDIVNLTISEFEATQWNETGLLQPGRHTLVVFASNSIGGELSTFDFSFTVPAPSAALAMALLIVHPRRRRAG